ncbi:MAG: hypothetical protein KQH83_11940 [Actinobacteria bacterium]|nr:hypothetical protein [Actinomycetota bacterium]
MRRSIAVVLAALVSLAWTTPEADEAPAAPDLPDGFERLVDPEGLGGLFGYSVAVDGDRVVIGAPYSLVGRSPMGAVYVYTRHGIGWTVDRIDAGDSWTGSRAALAKRDRNFGYSVDVAGDRVVVGAWGDWVSGQESGSVFVFDLVDGAWVGTRLHHDDIDPSDGVGYQVEISDDGNRILAGSLKRGGSNYRGKAFLFEWDGEAWTGRLFRASDGEKPDQFGSSIGLGDGFVVMGSPYHDGRRGAVYVYDERDGDWVETKIDPPDPVPGGYFGAGLSVHGDSVLIGSADRDTAYEMVRVGGEWVIDDLDLAAPPGPQGEVEVGVGDDPVPTGTWSPAGGGLLYVPDFGTKGPAKDPGAVRILQEQGPGWTEVGRYDGADFGEGEAFGWGLAIDGEHLVITAPLHDIGGEPVGAAYAQGFAPVCGGYIPTILGTAGDDEITGTPGDDVIAPGDGDDLIHVTGGRDVYCLNSGDARFTGPVEFVRTGRDGAEILVTARPRPGWHLLVAV